MSRVIKSFFRIKIIKEDKVLLLLSLIPLIVGVCVYVALGLGCTRVLFQEELSGFRIK